MSDELRPEVTGLDQMLVGGEWIVAADGRTFATVDPANEEEIGVVPLAGAAEVGQAVDAARAAMSGDWSALSPAARGGLLYRLADLVAEHAEELARLEALDNGKPARIAAIADIPQLIEYLRYYAGWPTKIEGQTLPVSVPSTFVYAKPRPVGVCALIVPWNFPLLSIAHKVTPALAAGCAVILKPAEQTPLTALRFGQLVTEAGFPAGAFNVLTGDGSTGALLVEHPGVDKVSFTGSTAVGRLVAESAARSLKRVTLELGGKNPAVVLPDANVDLVAKGAYLSAYFNSGQVCLAGSRMYVHRDRIDEVVDKVAARATRTRLGPGLAADTQLGPLVSAEQRRRVSGYIDAGLEGGADLRAGGPDAAVPERGYFVAPTLLVTEDGDLSVAREEIFGPVLVVMPYDDIDEVVAKANDTDYGLGAYLWTSDVGNAHRISDALDAGTVFVNTPTNGDPAAPFGGLKQSGYGRESGKAGVEDYLETKTIWVGLS